MSETDYIRGKQMAMREILQTCISGLGDDERTAESWRIERAATVAALRRVCESHGDNDWPDDLQLEDVVEKHLARHLD